MATLGQQLQVIQGCRVQYNKPASGRHGWCGTVKWASPTQLMVKYDNGVEQQYRLDAVQWAPVRGVLPELYGSLVAARKVDSVYAYLKLVDYETPKESQPKREPERKPLDYRAYIVAGAQGGDPRFHTSLEQAEADAKALAQRSNSGQAVRVYRCVVEYQRQEPPVERREVND